MRLNSRGVLASAVAAVLASGVMASAQSKYDTGASDTEIVIGNTLPYTGPVSAFGVIGKAISAYFDKVNAEGGVNGRKIRFISLDDAYSPPRAIEQTRKLVEQEKVLFIYQTIGTASNVALQTYLTENKVPQLLVGGGASRFNNPKEFPWTSQWQPTFDSVGDAFGQFILNEHPDAKVGVLYQNDDVGKDYLFGLKRALGKEHAGLIVKEVSYEITDTSIQSQIATLRDSGATVFVDFSTPKFAAQAIRRLYDTGWEPVHLLADVSNSIAGALKPAGLEESTGVISAGYLMDPNDPRWQETQDYKDWVAFMKQYYPDGNLSDGFNVIGYVGAKLLVEVLTKAGDDLTRENIVKAASTIQNLSLPMLYPGITINTSPDDYRAIKQVQLIRFNGEVWEPFGDLITAQ